MIQRELARFSAALGATMAVAACGTPAPRAFTFRDAEFMPADRGTPAAQAFIAARLPPGLPVHEARERLARAGMRCNEPSDRDATTVCNFTELVHNEGGTVGEDHFTVRLRAAQGLLVSAELAHFNIGTGNPNP